MPTEADGTATQTPLPDTEPGGEPAAPVDGRVGRYRIERRLGGGGMGVVFLAHDPDLDRHVAIKVLRPELRASRARLLREGQAVARLRHPNVVTVYDVGEHGDDLFIAMEYVAGATLRSWATAARPWREVLAMVVDAGRGLAAAHAAGLVHRDFKPDNVLIGDDGRAVVTDFGVARLDPGAGDAGSDDPELTRTGTLLGTPAYMSPEQFAARPADARSDQFSFCVTAWHALLGVRPFEPADRRPSVEELAEAVLAGAIRPPPAGHRVPAQVIAALRRGLSVAPEDRFPSMDALLAALAPRRSRVAIVTGGVGLGLAAAAAALVLSRGGATPAATCDAAAAVDEIWNPEVRAAYLARVGSTPYAGQDVAWFDEYAAAWREARQVVCDEAPRAADDPRARCLADALDQLGAAVARPADEAEMWPLLAPLAACRDGGIAAPTIRPLDDEVPIKQMSAISPDGSQIARQLGRSILVTTTGGDAVASFELPERASVVDWFPDGDWLVERSGELLVLDRDGRQRRAAGLAPFGAASLDPDGTRLAYVEHGVLRVRDVVVGAPAATFDITDGMVGAVAWSPDGGRIAVGVIAEGVRRIEIVDLATGAVAAIPVRAVPRVTGTLFPTWHRDGELIIAGGAPAGDSEDLWVLRIDAAGRLTGPPERRLAAADRTAYHFAGRDGRGLLVRETYREELVRVAGGRSEPLPRTVARADLLGWSADDRRLAIRNRRRLAWYTLATGAEEVIEVPRGDYAVRGGAIVRLQGEGGRWDLVELAAGGEVFVANIQVKEGVTPHVACGATPPVCVFWTLGDSGVTIVPIGGAPRSVPGRFDDPSVEISPDGAGAAVIGKVGVVDVVDLASGSVATWSAAKGCLHGYGGWSRDGRALYLTSGCEGGWGLDRVTTKGVERIWDAPGFLSGLEVGPTDELYTRVVIATSSLFLVEGL